MTTVRIIAIKKHKLSHCGPPGDHFMNLTRVDAVKGWYSFHIKCIGMKASLWLAVDWHAPRAWCHTHSHHSGGGGGGMFLLCQGHHCRPVQAGCSLNQHLISPAAAAAAAAAAASACCCCCCCPDPQPC